MPELGFIVFLIALSYGLGVVWYKLLGAGHSGWMRTAAAPFIGVAVGEGVWGAYLASGPAYFDVHIALALVTSLVAVLADVSIIRIVGSIVRPILDALQLGPEND
jgi:hypothetical protein